MYKRLLISIMALAITGSSCQMLNAQLTAKYKNYEELVYKEMKYGLFKPKHYDKNKSYPLVLVLNSLYDTIPHDFPYYSDSFQQKQPCFVLSPISPGDPYIPGQGWLDIPEIGSINADLSKAIEIFDLTLNTYNIDLNRLYIHGCSMGGFGVYTLLSNFPGKFAAAYIIAGGCNTGIAENLKNTPLWIFHGQIDEIVPVDFSRNIYNEIRKLGGENIRYTEYTGVKHDSWKNVLKEKTLETWLFKQEKGMPYESPGKLEGLRIEANGNEIILKWNLPKKTPNTNEEIWYYKIFRNDILIAEIDGDNTSYSDKISFDHYKYSYRIAGVNYYFKESELSETVRIE